MHKKNLEDLFNQYLKLIASALNDIHKCSLSDYAWKGMLGYWLRSVLNNSLIFYENHKLFLKDYDKNQDILITGYDTTDAMEIINSSSHIPKLLFLLSLCKKKETEKFFLNQKKISIHTRRKETLTKNFYRKFFNSMFSKKRLDLVVFSDFQMRPFDLIKLAFKLNKFSLIFNELDFLLQPKLSINFDKRLELQKKVKSEDEFSYFLSWIISLTIPVIYFEDFDRQKNNVLKKIEKKLTNCKILVSSTGWYYNESFKLFTFIFKPEKAVLIGHQHGGNYGVVENFFLEEFEREIVDFYISWGWQGKNVLALPSPKLSSHLKNLRNREVNEKSILYISTTYPTIPVDDRYQIGCLDKYLENMRRFIGSLSEKSISAIRLRPYQKTSQIIHEIWSEFDPNIQIENWNTSLLRSLNSSKLCICDNLQTTFLESLATNTPTILYLDKNMKSAKYRDDVSDYFNLLEEVNIFYQDAVQAAKFINRLLATENGIDDWWCSKEVQNARAKYCYTFARTSDRFIIEWAKTIDQF